MEQMASMFGGQLGDLWNKRKVDQLRSQIEDLRHSLDEVGKNYNRVMGTGSELLGDTQRRMARQAGERFEEIGGQLTGEGGFSWWIPVAVLGFIGAAAWLYNQFTSGATETARQPFTTYPAGTQPSTPQPPFMEQR
jgi:hypothetical protein